MDKIYIRGLRVYAYHGVKMCIRDSICVFRPFLRLRGGQAGGRTGLRSVRDRLSRGRAAGERGGHAVPPGEIGAGGGTDADELHPLDRKGGG